MEGINYGAFPTNGAAVTPSDTVDLNPGVLALYVGTAGDLEVEYKGGNVVVFKNVPAGTILSGRFVKVLDTNTTADNIVGMF